METVPYLSARDVDYAVALGWQHATAEGLRAGGAAPGRQAAEAVALIEHTPVYTMGARGGRASVRGPVQALRAPLIDTDRGGDITWHGPGQLVAYPILHLRRRGLSAGEYLAALEGTLIDTLGAFGIHGALIAGRRGVWVGNDKIAAIGIRIQGSVSMHGVALNVAPDLDWFAPIVPCGIEDAGVTSMARVLGAAPAIADVAAALRAAFEGRFACTLVEARADALTRAPAGLLERPLARAAVPA